MVDIKLTSDEEQQLRSLAAQITSLEKTITAMERAGVDMTEEREALKRAETLRQGFLREFGTRGRARA